MKLIDADALNKQLQKCVGSPTDDKLYDVNLCIIDAPTIDAIPVEWLKLKLKEAVDNSVLYGNADSWNKSKSIWNVLQLWQKEQEAR